MHLRLHLSSACIALVSELNNAQKNSPNDGPDAALEDTFYVVIESVP